MKIEAYFKSSVEQYWSLFGLNSHHDLFYDMTVKNYKIMVC